MAELPERLAGQLERRQFIRRSSQMTLGAMVVLASGSGLHMASGHEEPAHRRNATPGILGNPPVKGITLSGLQTDSAGNTFKTQSEVENEIAASQSNFGATHIRLQIQQQTLVGDDGTQYNSTYGTTVYQTIKYALGLGLTVIINCQTEQSWASTRNYPYPNCNGNTATNQFWTYMLTPQGRTGGNFGGNANIICDLFNEPQCGPDWAIWQTQYDGVIDYIRSTLGITSNQLWADADNYAASLDGCPGLTDPAGNLVYSFHHPASGPGGDTSGWDTNFGNWAASHAVVNGEFAQNSTRFNWGSPYVVQQYLNYCAGKGISQTIYTDYGDDYFSDINGMPYGWWGNMINNFWNPGDGWATYCFRSSVAWSQNYIMSTGAQLSWTNGLYQGWSVSENSMLAGVAGFNSFTADMSTGTQYRMHVSFQCVWADNTIVTAVVGVHGASSKPSSWSGVTPRQTNITELAGLSSGDWYNADIPSSYLSQFASGYYKGIVFGPGPSSDGAYEGHMSFSPEVVIEVHA